jgi:uncharacterized protein YcfL
MKKVFAIFAIATLAACGGASTEATTDSTTVTVDSTAVVADTTATSASTATGGTVDSKDIK